MAGTLVTDAVKSSTSSPPTFQNTSGTEVGQLCRAWVNFNGVTTASIRAAFNVSSVTRNATGDYTVNFSNALQDANYSVVGMGQRSTSWAAGVMVYYGASQTQTPSSVRVITTGGNTWGIEDLPVVNVSVFR